MFRFQPHFLILVLALLITQNLITPAKIYGQTKVSTGKVNSSKNPAKESHVIFENTLPGQDSIKEAALAQSRRSMVHLLPPEKLTKDYTDALKQILNLAPEQYDKIIQVNRVLIDKIDALVYTSKDYYSFKQALATADKERLAHYKEILSPLQLKTYAKDSTLTGLVKVMTKTSVSQGPPTMRAFKN